MRKFLRWMLVVFVAMAIIAILALIAIDRAARQAPEFYRRAVAASPEKLHAHGERFERQALALHNQLQHEGRWQVRFTQEEINGWLAAELPAKFPRALPHGLSEPRVAIEHGVAHVAVRYQRGDMTAVISLAGEVHLTNQPNELAIRIDRVRAGLLPVPLGRFLDEITQRAAAAGWQLHWTETDGSPVALLRLPLDRAGSGEGDARRPLVLDEVKLGDGDLIIAGTTGNEADPSANGPAVEKMPSQPATGPAEKASDQR